MEALFAQAGFETRSLSHGADGGVDIWLYSRNQPDGKPVSLVQRKHWTSRPVGVDKVRELRGVMAARDVRRGQFATTSTFTADAIAFGRDNGIDLLDVRGLLALIAQRTPISSRRCSTSRSKAILAADLRGLRRQDRRAPAAQRRQRVLGLRRLSSLQDEDGDAAAVVLMGVPAVLRIRPTVRRCVRSGRARRPHQRLPDTPGADGPGARRDTDPVRLRRRAAVQKRPRRSLLLRAPQRPTFGCRTPSPAMLTVHHLNDPRSQRVLWLLEELGVTHEIGITSATR